MKRKSILQVASLFLVITILSTFFLYKNTDLFVKPKKDDVPQSDIFDGIGYSSVEEGKFDVSVLSSEISFPTRMQITPGGKFLLVSQLTGELISFSRNETGWSNKPELVATIETRFPGFPPDEAGLVGITFSAEYEKNGKIFLLYTYRSSDTEILNRISMISVKEENSKLISSKPELIYTANIPGNVSHQVTEAISLLVEDKPHLLFAIGEGFQAQRAQDKNLEAGKLILIQEDGSDPLGARPYTENKKIQSLGIRNAYVIAQNPFDTQKRLMIGDTGPSKFDRLVYTNPLGEKSVNFNWDGTEESLKELIPDPNISGLKDIVLTRLEDALTFTGLAFHPGNNSIPKSDSEKQSVLVTVFGKTGSLENSPGKEIWLGELSTQDGEPKLSLKPIIHRNPSASGKLGNPLGLVVDTKTGDFIFADIIEGKIYKVSAK